MSVCLFCFSIRKKCRYDTKYFSGFFPVFFFRFFLGRCKECIEHAKSCDNDEELGLSRGFMYVRDLCVQICEGFMR